MGTIVEITVVAKDKESADEAMTAAFKEIQRLEKIMSTYMPSSDISKVNDGAGLHPVKVHKDLILSVNKALKVSELSGGAFNIALGPAIDLWASPALNEVKTSLALVSRSSSPESSSGEGEAKTVTDSNRVPSKKELAAIRPLIDYKNIIVNEQDGTIFLKKKGMRINLGGIGKGFASEYAYTVLTKYGIKSGIIAVAGDLRVFGKRPDGSLWNIGIKHPRRKDSIVAKVHLTDMAVSTSGDYERFFIKNGVIYHHILAPDTLMPARGSQSVSIITNDSAMADALATAIFAAGPEKGLKIIEDMPDVEGIIVRDNGQIETSSGLKGNARVIIEIIE